MQPFDQEPEEIEIDFKLLLFSILRRWKVLFVCGILGLALGVVYNLLPEAEPTMADIDMDKVVVEKVADYAATHEMIKYQDQYEAESLLMKMDPDNAHQASIRYYLSAHSTDIELIALRFNNILADEAVRQELFELSGGDYNINYLGEIIYSSYSLGENFVTQLNSFDDLQKIPRNGQLSFHIWAMDEEQCQTLLTALQKHISEVDAACQASYEGYSLQLLSEQHTDGRQDALINLHQSATDKRLAYANAIETYEKEFTDDEKLYAKLVYPTDKEEEEDHFSLIKLILPAFILEFLLLAYFLLKGIFSHAVHGAEQLNDLGIYHVAHLKQGKKLKGIDAWLHHLEHKNDIPAVSQEYLLKTFDLLDAKQIAVCSDHNDTVLSELGTWLAKESNKVQHIGNLYNDDNALVAAKGTDGVVLLVKIDHTTRDEVKRSLDICQQMNFPVIGAVTVE